MAQRFEGEFESFLHNKGLGFIKANIEGVDCRFVMHKTELKDFSKTIVGVGVKVSFNVIKPRENKFDLEKGRLLNAVNGILISDKLNERLASSEEVLQLLETGECK